MSDGDKVHLEELAEPHVDADAEVREAVDVEERPRRRRDDLVDVRITD